MLQKNPNELFGQPNIFDMFLYITVKKFVLKKKKFLFQLSQVWPVKVQAGDKMKRGEKGQGIYSPSFLLLGQYGLPSSLE